MGQHVMTFDGDPSTTFPDIIFVLSLIAHDLAVQFPPFLTPGYLLLPAVNRQHNKFRSINSAAAGYLMSRPTPVTHR